MARPLKGTLTNKQVAEEIAKQRKHLKDLERIQKLQKKFNLSKPSRTTRAKLTRRIAKSTVATKAAKKSVKIFSVKDQRGKRVLIAGVPKGIKIRKKK